MALGDETSAGMFYPVRVPDAPRDHQQQWLFGQQNVVITRPTDAFFIKFQVGVTANIRYTLDGLPATPTYGFRLPAEHGTVESVRAASLNVCVETDDLVALDYMWMARHRSGGG